MFRNKKYKYDLFISLIGKRIALVSLGVVILFCGYAQSQPDLTWGNSNYFYVNIGDTIYFNNSKITLQKISKHFNTLDINGYEVELKVSRRTLPYSTNGIRIFVADNINIKKAGNNFGAHNLLEKDAVLCISKVTQKLLPNHSFVFPVSFNDGFIWNLLEDRYMFAYCTGYSNSDEGFSYPGIGIDLSDARGVQKHWLVAMENSSVVWIKDKKLDRLNKEACVLMQSESNPKIFYVYNHLYNKSVEVRKGQKLIRGEIVGTAWGDEKWGHVQISVIHSDTIPAYKDCLKNCINFFPQIFELYFKQSFSFSKTFTKGKIKFGRISLSEGDRINVLNFQDYTGKGWKFGKWNLSEKLMVVSKGHKGNARLKKKLFEGSLAEAHNPENYYDYEINVRNGVYRIRAQVGDIEKESWQRVEFEGKEAANYNLPAGGFKWTSEKVVRVEDRRLTVRIYVDSKNEKVAGLSEIVFQQAY